MLVVGKTDSRGLNALIAEYVGRVSHFVPFEMTCIPDLKSTRSLSEAQQKIQEGASASAACREAASASGFAKSEIYRMLLSKKEE